MCDAFGSLFLNLELFFGGEQEGASLSLSSPPTSSPPAALSCGDHPCHEGQSPHWDNKSPPLMLPEHFSSIPSRNLHPCLTSVQGKHPLSTCRGHGANSRKVQLSLGQTWSKRGCLRTGGPRIIPHCPPCSKEAQVAGADCM